MKPFESFIADKLEEFILYRHEFGLQEGSVRASLRRFDHHIICKNAGWHDFTPLFFLEYQRSITGDGRIANSSLTVVRGFFQFLVRRQYIDQNPLRDIPAKQENRYVPFIFSPEDVDRLLDLIKNRIRKTEKMFFLDYTVYTTILLIARCGLRISEPLKLTVSSYRPKEKTIYIEKTKFHKDRLIPLPFNMAMDLENYLRFRKRYSSNCTYLFPGVIPAKTLTSRSIYPIFHWAVKEIGQNHPRRILGTTTFGAPRIHSLRHSFATNTLNNIKQRGVNPQKGLPVLSAYMGHRKYSYTSLYLKMLDAEQRNNLVDFTLSHREEL